MTALSFTSFAGEIPRMGKQQLPNNAASTAENCLLLSGEIRGLHKPVALFQFNPSPVINRAFSLEETDTYDATWIGFNDETVFFQKGPLTSDAYDRYYMTSDNDDPRMNTRARIESSSAWYLLGTPAPSNTMTVTPDGSGSGSTVTRAYVFTFVSPYGEEGPTSDPVIATGLDDDQWDLGNMDTTISDASERPSGYTKRIYRTVTGVSGTAAYHFVAEIALATATYADTETTDSVALNDTCESFYWQPPPATLRGLKSHPSGFMVGYDGHDIWFSEPYRPHAWNPGYVLSTDQEIIGLGVFGNTIAVMTKGFPYAIYGSHPSSMASVKHNASEPCVSRWSIVEMPFGVYYASINGLQLTTATSVTNATQQLITRDEWASEYDLTTLKAARYNDYYVGFYTNTDGFMFAPSEPMAMFTSLRNYWDVDNIQTDTETGLTVILKDNIVKEWNSPYGERKNYTWKSKQFVLPKPINMSAYRFSSYSYDPSGAEENAARVAFNTARIATPLMPLGSDLLGKGVSRNITGGEDYENQSPLGGPILQDLSFSYDSLTINFYSDNELVFSNLVTTTAPLRFPSGFKSTLVEFELVGNLPVSSFRVASSMKELARV